MTTKHKRTTYVTCFACKQERELANIKKSGQKFGNTWYLCLWCSDRFREQKLLESEKARYRGGICCPRCGSIDGRKDDGKRFSEGRRVWCEDCGFEFLLTDNTQEDAWDEET